MHPGCQLLDKGQEKSKRKHGEDRLDTELKPNIFKPMDSKTAINEEVSVVNGKPVAQKTMEADTRHSTCRNVIRQKENGPSDTVKDHPKSDH